MKRLQQLPTRIAEWLFSLSGQPNPADFIIPLTQLVLDARDEVLLERIKTSGALSATVEEQSLMNKRDKGMPWSEYIESLQDDGSSRASLEDKIDELPYPVQQRVALRAKELTDIELRNLGGHSVPEEDAAAIERAREFFQDDEERLFTAESGGRDFADLRVKIDEAQARKDTPVFSGVMNYFPDALREVARVSKAGNDQHNPGQPLHWSRGKSKDHADCIARHLLDNGTIDSDGMRHSAKVAWRALALLQEEIENDRS